MKLGDLKKLLEGWGNDVDVVVRVSSYSNDPIDDGDILEISDERSILVEYGKLTIVADVPED